MTTPRRSHGQTDEEQSPADVARMAALSDGVFAIAITLLVLPLTDADLRGGDIATELRELLPQFLVFVLSFAVIARLWIGHHDDVRAMTGAGRRVLVANLVFLFFVVFLPFPTALLGEVGGELPTLIYAATIVLTALSSLALWRAAEGAGLIDDPTGRSAPRTYGTLAVAAGFVPSLGLVFLSTTAAQASWWLALVFSVAADRVEARRRG